MKIWAAFVFLLLTASSVEADIIHKIMSSISLTVDGAGSVATRIPSTYTVSGSNIKVESGANFGGLTAPGSVTAAATQIQAAYNINTVGSAFSLTEGFTQGDAIPSGGTTVHSGVVSSLPAFGSVTTTSGGSPSTLAGTLTSAHLQTITAGGPGTSATGQFVTEITIR